MSDDLCHWNTCLPNGMALLPVRCTRTAGHSGLHVCGDTSAGEALGVRIDDATVEPDPAVAEVSTAAEAILDVEW